jgi:hypothetical protein
MSTSHVSTSFLKMKIYVYLEIVVGAVDLLKWGRSGGGAWFYTVDEKAGECAKEGGVVENSARTEIHNGRNPGACWNIVQDVCLQGVDLCVKLRKRETVAMVTALVLL